ncbi:MAG TPA: glutamate formiminotransferase [Candidatus Dormibacteraeota bacterium]|nr:glutamate formiminotransferase [Candidatus Dormibacteraeota bacterium]
MEIYESVPNFSEGTRRHVIDAIGAAASPAFVLDSDPDPDHNRVVVSLAGARSRLADGLRGAIAAAVEHIDLRVHYGVHPRVGAADVVPIVPLLGSSLESCRELAREIAEHVWSDLHVPVYFYGHGEHKTLADIRAGRVPLDLGGPALHPTAGAVSIGAREALVAFNVILFDYDLVAARALAASIRESRAGLRGVQALAFELSGHRVQLSMNLFRVDETTPSDVIAELERRGVEVGAQQVVGLSPVIAASPAADGRLLEGRLASAAAGEGSARCEKRGGEEMNALAIRLRMEAAELAALPADQDAMLGGGERAAALVHVLRAAKVADQEIEGLLNAAATGFRRAISPATQAVYRARVEALDARLVQAD